MAASSSFSSFLSFLLPPKQPQLHPPPVTRFSFQSHKLRAQHQDHHSPELPSHVIMNPSHAQANTLFFRSAYNVQVVVDENEPEERLLNRFRREVMKAGVIQECKRRRFFENKQEEKKRKNREAAKRKSRMRFVPSLLLLKLSFHFNLTFLINHQLYSYVELTLKLVSNTSSKFRKFCD